MIKFYTRGTLIILITLTTLLSSAYCQTSDLSPELIGDSYCFDSAQVRYIAKVIYQQPIKDSVITEQKGEIKDLNKRLNNKGVIIETQRVIIENDSLIIKKLENSVQNERDSGDLKVKREKHKAKKIKLIALIEGVIILLILIVK